ncbi:ATP-binding protein [Aureimonas pseudogalii]|uniref:Rad50/SbcC-type AAA domain-containing protein n=1 Tax=Aureimonas pseudogalii TaxID=1744844 RepID=A0A7W6MKL4_9HYPH|nr:AAA family ATPase [Aureimonas pseudogalii]MBB3999088.1 hypothetical protein [Aureimonas pseudogalii]
MNDLPRTAVALHLLTIETLLDDLIGGRTVALENGPTLALDDGPRSALDWYRRNRDKWSGNLRGDDADAIVDAVGAAPPPARSERPPAVARPTRVLRLARVRAHRFAGLHSYGCTGEDTHFVFDAGKPVTLLEGVNGSGKTSLANAVCGV